MAGIKINILSNFNASGFDKLQRELKRLDTPMEKLGAVSKALAPAAQIGITALTAMGISAVRAAEEAQLANNRLDAVAKSMNLFGSATDQVTDRLKAFAEENEKSLAVDADIIKATQAKLLTFKNLAKTADEVGGSMDRATLAAVDLAAAGFGSAEQNAVQLGKALQDPIKGITALARSGVTFTEQEKEKIKALTESGKILEAQNMILGAIETQVGGTAAATATGSQKMALAFLALQDSIGEALLPVFEQLVPLVTGFFDYLAKNSSVLTIIGAAMAALSVAILAVNFALNANPIVKVITLIGVLATGVALLIDWLVKLYGGWDKLFKDIGKLLNGFFETFKSVWGSITGFFTTVVNGYISIWEGFINKVIGGLNGIIGLANSALDIIKNLSFGTIDINIPTIPNVNVPKVGGKAPAKTPAKTPAKAPKTIKIPKLATGGIVMPVPGGVLANLAEAGQPEAVIPLSKLGQYTNNKPTAVYNINVSGGLESSASIGKRVVEAIKAYERTSGTVFQGV
jgi:hypothetical protein